MIFIMWIFISMSSILNRIKIWFKFDRFAGIFHILFFFHSNKTITNDWARLTERKSKTAAAVAVLALVSATFIVCLDISPRTIEQNTQWHQITFYGLTNKHCYEFMSERNAARFSSSSNIVCHTKVDVKRIYWPSIYIRNDVRLENWKCRQTFKWVNH